MPPVVSHGFYNYYNFCNLTWRLNSSWKLLQMIYNNHVAFFLGWCNVVLSDVAYEISCTFVVNRYISNMLDSIWGWSSFSSYLRTYRDHEFDGVGINLLKGSCPANSTCFYVDLWFMFLSLLFFVNTMGCEHDLHATRYKLFLLVLLHGGLLSLFVHSLFFWECERKNVRYDSKISVGGDIMWTFEKQFRVFG